MTPLLLLLLSPHLSLSSTITINNSRIQTFHLQPTSQLLNKHHRNLSFLHNTPHHHRNSAVYATLEPFLASLPEDEKESFLNRFNDARQLSRHERFHRMSLKGNMRGRRRVSLYEDPRPREEEEEEEINWEAESQGDGITELAEINGDSGDPLVEEQQSSKDVPFSAIGIEGDSVNESETSNENSDSGIDIDMVDERNLKVEGGLLNTYQPAPLLQGYGTHYATIWVGTPPQRKSAIVDTGSHYTAFPCTGCNNCGEENHTDDYFDPDKSSTFHALRCDECVASRCEENKCTFSQMYTEGSSWQAYQVKDRFFVGKNQVFGRDDPVDNSFAIPFMFGCQTSETGLFVTQLADGIMGMSSHEATLPKQMYNLGKIQHNMFTLCFRRELHVSKEGITAGIMTLGGIDTRLHTSPMLYTKNVVKNGWYTVYVRNVFLRKGGGPSARSEREGDMIIRLPLDMNEINSGKGVIVDSGTTDTYLHKSLGAGFREAWKSATGTSYSNSPVRLSDEQLVALPTVLIQMSAFEDGDGVEDDPRQVVGLAGDLDPRRPRDIILAVPAEHYMEYSPSKDTYTSRLYFTETRGGVIGANAMQGHDVLFDWENGRVGFAESSCNYGLLEENIDNTPADAIEAGVGVDCHLSQASIASSCAASIDEPLIKCQDAGNSGAAMLSGSEKWVWVVENGGTENGASCEEVAMKQAQSKGLIGAQETLTALECDDNGLCYMVKECSISCGDLMKAPPRPAQEASGVRCGDDRWGACTAGCTQSKVHSILMDDGKCHKVHSDVHTRPCHIQECARDDPCRVPFVVHAVIGLVGVRADLWNARAEEQFLEALARVSGGFGPQGPVQSLSKGSVFGPGDISVLMVSQWSPLENTNPKQPSGDASNGLKLILEISIFNPTAKLAPGQDDKVNDDANSTMTGITAVLDKINFLKSDSKTPKSICEEKELYPYAKHAMRIHTQLQDPQFLSTLANNIQYDPEDRTNPFQFMQRRNNVEMSKVLTSWTIKTEIGGQGSLHDHARDEMLLRGGPKPLKVVKEFFSDGWLLVGVAVILVAFLLIGAKCGYNCGAREQLRMMTAHANNLMDTIKARTTDSGRGRYRPVQGQEATELELT